MPAAAKKKDYAAQRQRESGEIRNLQSVGAENVTLSLLQDAASTSCLDGTPGGYYYQPSAASHTSKKWVIYLNGGGECDNEKGCLQQAETALGSSKYFPQQSEAKGWFAGSDDCNVNPLFCEWNHVFNPYCSQDLHSGQGGAAWGLKFNGHNIVSAIFDEMDKQGDMQNADEIIVSGASAGGLGVWMNVDYVAKRYPNAKVTGLSVAGFYYPAVFYDGPDARTYYNDSTMADFRLQGLPGMYALYNAYVDTDCADAYNGNESTTAAAPAPCMMANFSQPYVSSPVFVVQSLSDEVVLQYHDLMPDVPAQPRMLPQEKSFMLQWSQNMTSALTAPSRNIAGVFAAACWVHTGFNYQAPLIDDLTWRQAFNAYYKDPSAEHVHIDLCGDDVLCNKTCPPV